MSSACSDSVTGPEIRPTGGKPSYDADGRPLPPNAAQSEMPAQANSMLTYPWTQFGVSYAEPTLVEVTVTGVNSAFYGPNEDRFGEDVGAFWNDIDPGGWATGSMQPCGHAVEVRFTLAGRAEFCDGNNQNGIIATRVDTAIAKGYPRMTRLKGPYLDGCNTVSTGPCFVFTGSQNITVKPIADKLQLFASAATVQALEEVSFTASTSNGVPFAIRDWTWLPDDGSPPVVHRGGGAEGLSLEIRDRVSADLAGGAAACVITNPVCTDSVINSGTMYVRAWVVNKIEQAEAHVEVIRDRLIVTPAATSVQLGQSVTWVASTVQGGSFEMKRWVWVSEREVQGLMEPDSCGIATTCTLPVYESGTIEAYAILEGETAETSASGDADVTSCPTPYGNPTLDDPTVLGAMKKFHDESNPFDPNTENRRERMWAVLKDKVTGAIRVEDLTVVSTPCISVGKNPSQFFPNDSVLVRGHSHAGYPREWLMCEPNKPDTIVSGGSNRDWVGVMNTGVTEWITRNDMIFRLVNGVLPMGDEFKPENFWPWNPATGCRQ